jgi:hypothetical protein
MNGLMRYITNTAQDFREIKNLSENYFANREHVSTSDLLTMEKKAEKYLQTSETGRDRNRARFQGLTLVLVGLIVTFLVSSLNGIAVHAKFFVISLGVGASFFSYVSNTLNKQKIFACYRILIDIAKKLERTVCFYEAFSSCIRNKEGLTRHFFSTGDILSKEIVGALILYLAISILLLVM